MDETSWVFCSVYLDVPTDESLRALAEASPLSRGAMFRRCVATGLRRLGEGLEMPECDDGMRLSVP